MKLPLVTVLLFLTVAVFSQQNSEYKQAPVYLEKYQVTANLLAPGVGFERRLIGNTSFSSGFIPGFSSFGAGNSFGYALQTRLRWYTNMKLRSANNKHIGGNSGDYIALANNIIAGGVQITGNLEAPEDFTVVFNGALYGIQRKAFKRRFTWNAEIGVGRYYGNGIDNGTGFLINLNFGWVLINKR